VLTLHRKPPPGGFFFRDHFFLHFRGEQTAQRPLRLFKQKAPRKLQCSRLFYLWE
jgi:hypothetical protein